jgi:hypothetical protein
MLSNSVKNKTLFKHITVMNDWRISYNLELTVLYSSQNIVRIIKSRRTRWLGDVARMGDKKDVYRDFGGKS